MLRQRSDWNISGLYCCATAESAEIAIKRVMKMFAERRTNSSTRFLPECWRINYGTRFAQTRVRTSVSIGCVFEKVELTLAARAFGLVVEDAAAVERFGDGVLVGDSGVEIGFRVEAF